MKFKVATYFPFFFFTLVIRLLIQMFFQKKKQKKIEDQIQNLEKKNQCFNSQWYFREYTVQSA